MHVVRGWRPCSQRHQLVVVTSGGAPGTRVLANRLAHVQAWPGPPWSSAHRSYKPCPWRLRRHCATMYTDTAATAMQAPLICSGGLTPIPVRPSTSFCSDMAKTSTAHQPACARQPSARKAATLSGVEAGLHEGAQRQRHEVSCASAALLQWSG